MVDLWYFLVAAMFAAYVVLDGYVLGAGIVQPFVAKTDHERHSVIASIAPVWDAHEVFLVAGGATLYLAFPRLFPAFVSGFYLPVMMVLWLLALRGLAIEMRHKLDHPLWNALWDGGFFVGSSLLVVFFGAALGNVVRGVSVDDEGNFFAPLWTDFSVGTDVGVIDWYTLLVALTAVSTIAQQGALRLSGVAEVGEDVGERAAAIARRIAPVSTGLVLVATLATLRVQPHVGEGLRARPWSLALVAVVLAGCVASVVLTRPSRVARLGRPLASRRAFAATSAALAALFGCACLGVYPFGLLARTPGRSVLAVDAAAGSYSLRTGLMWWVPGMLLVIAWLALRRHLGRSTVVRSTVGEPSSKRASER